MKKSILMLLSLFMLGACSLASEDALFLEEVAGKTITIEGTSYAFSSDGTILHSSALSFEFHSTSSSTEATYKTVLYGATHSITVKINDNMISMSGIEKPLFLLAVSGKSVKIDGTSYTFSTDGLTIDYSSEMHSYWLEDVTSSTEATYSDNAGDIYTISIDSVGNISAVLSSSVKDGEFLTLVVEGEEVDGYLISPDGKTIYTEDKDYRTVYFKFVVAESITTNESKVITATATYEAIVDGEHLTYITVTVVDNKVSIDYGYTETSGDKGKANFLIAAFKAQVGGKTVTKDGVKYGFSAFGNTLTKFVDGGDDDVDYIFVVDETTGEKTAYEATYEKVGDTSTKLDVTIKGGVISITEPTS